MYVGKYSVFGVFLKQKRVEAGLSQKEVADKLNYGSGQFISDWERGLANPPLKVVRKLAKMYSVTDDVIFNLMLEATIEVMRRDWELEFYGKTRKRS